MFFSWLKASNLLFLIKYVILYELFKGVNMKAINLTKREYANLKPLPLDKSIFNTEAKMSILPIKEKWLYQNKVLKRLFVTEGDLFGNKLYTVNALIDRHDQFDSKLIIPDHLAVVGDDVVGFTSPYIENTNLGVLLKSPKLSSIQKKAYLEQIGNILKMLSQNRKYGVLEDFYIGDLHEYNFILNNETNEINVTDLDSCKIAHNQPFPSNYLATAKEIKKLPVKYPVLDINDNALNIPDENSDLFCFNMMILNYLYGDKIQRLTMEEFYEYLNYLSSLKINSELIAIFSRLYDNQNNENPGELISQIPDDLSKTNHLAFKHKTRRQ